MTEGMTIPVMLGQSGILTLLGMCVVFSFLIVLILFMKLTNLIVRSFGWDKQKKEDVPAPAATPAGGQDQAVVAAIAAAIKDKT